ncbi:MAG: hypothetical protein M3P40_11485 [Actinomycetota bacterium]|nr:hypothetical protein [Actinomycetota bacterium]
MTAPRAVTVAAVIHPADARTRAAITAEPAVIEVVEAGPRWHEAVQAGFDETGADWLWLVAAGVVPQEGTLAALLAALDLAGEGPAGELPRPVLLSSRIVARDGTPDPSSAPWVPLIDRAVVMAAAARGLAAVRFARWGSLLVDRAAIEHHGLPREDFATGADDLEWTGRILLNAAGYAVPDSVAVRETPRANGVVGELQGRARMLRGNGWEGAEPLWFVYETVRGMGRSPSRSPRAITARLRGRSRLKRA